MTTHTYLHVLSEMEVQDLCTSIGMDQELVFCYLLQEFDTEQDFSNKVGYVHLCRQDCVITRFSKYHLSCLKHKVHKHRNMLKAGGT